jgi:hypothetical protein
VGGPYHYDNRASTATTPNDHSQHCEPEDADPWMPGNLERGRGLNAPIPLATEKDERERGVVSSRASPEGQV